MPTSGIHLARVSLGGWRQLRGAAETGNKHFETSPPYLSIYFDKCVLLWLFVKPALLCWLAVAWIPPLNPFLLWLRSSAFGAFPWVKRVINGFPAARAKIFFEICSAACFPALCVKLLSTQQTLSRWGPTQLFLWCIHSMQHHWKLYSTPCFTSCLSHDLLHRNLRDFECVFMREFFPECVAKGSRL